MCGADAGVALWALRSLGSPPRVRSRLHGRILMGDIAGITSACAEQTPGGPTGRAATWDHLRVCGADALTHGDENAVEGSPPRVRSRLPTPFVFRFFPRITSACAEQTWRGP